MHHFVTLQGCSLHQNRSNLYEKSELAQGQMGGRQQHLVNTITPQKLPVSCFNFTGPFTTKILEEFEVDLCGPLLYCVCFIKS